jgi:hypothetical protein
MVGPKDGICKVGHRQDHRVASNLYCGVEIELPSLEEPSVECGAYQSRFSGYQFLHAALEFDNKFLLEINCGNLVAPSPGQQVGTKGV